LLRKRRKILGVHFFLPHPVDRVETYLFHGRDLRRVLPVRTFGIKRQTLSVVTLEWS